MTTKKFNREKLLEHLVRDVDSKLRARGYEGQNARISNLAGGQQTDMPDTFLQTASVSTKTPCKLDGP